MELNERIKIRRKELRLSQEQLSKLIGYTSISTITKIETGENNVPLNKLELFAKALNTSVEYLLKGSEQKHNSLSIFSNNKEIREKQIELIKILNELKLEDVIEIKIRAEIKLEEKNKDKEVKDGINKD